MLISPLRESPLHVDRPLDALLLLISLTQHGNHSMLYMVELRYQPEQRDDALKYFLQHGTVGYEGRVTLSSAWVATRDRIAYAVVSSDSVEEIEKACSPLREFGDVSFRAVTSVDQL